MARSPSAAAGDLPSTPPPLPGLCMSFAAPPPSHSHPKRGTGRTPSPSPSRGRRSATPNRLSASRMSARAKREKEKETPEQAAERTMRMKTDEAKQYYHALWSNRYTYRMLSESLHFLIRGPEEQETIDDLLMNILEIVEEADVDWDEAATLLAECTRLMENSVVKYQLRDEIFEFGRLPQQYYETLLILSRSVYNTKSFERAMFLYSRCSRSDDKSLSAFGHVGKGLCLEALHRLDDAVAEYSLARSEDPTNIFAYCFEGLLRLKQRKFDEAIQLCSSVIEIDPKNLFARIIRGDAYKFSSGFTYKKGMADYEVAYDVNNEIARKYIGKGFSLSDDYEATTFSIVRDLMPLCVAGRPKRAVDYTIPPARSLDTIRIRVALARRFPTLGLLKDVPKLDLHKLGQSEHNQRRRISRWASIRAVTRSGFLSSRTYDKPWLSGSKSSLGTEETGRSESRGSVRSSRSGRATPLRTRSKTILSPPKIATTSSDSALLDPRSPKSPQSPRRSPQSPHSIHRFAHSPRSPRSPRSPISAKSKSKGLESFRRFSSGSLRARERETETQRERDSGARRRLYSGSSGQTSVLSRSRLLELSRAKVDASPSPDVSEGFITPERLLLRDSDSKMPANLRRHLHQKSLAASYTSMGGFSAVYNTTAAGGMSNSPFATANGTNFGASSTPPNFSGNNPPNFGNNCPNSSENRVYISMSPRISYEQLKHSKEWKVVDLDVLNEDSLFLRQSQLGEREREKERERERGPERERETRGVVSSRGRESESENHTQSLRLEEEKGERAREETGEGEKEGNQREKENQTPTEERESPLSKPPKPKLPPIEIPSREADAKPEARERERERERESEGERTGGERDRAGESDTPASDMLSSYVSRLLRTRSMSSRATLRSQPSKSPRTPSPSLPPLSSARLHCGDIDIRDLHKALTPRNRQENAGIFTEVMAELIEESEKDVDDQLNATNRMYISEEAERIRTHRILDETSSPYSLKHSRLLNSGDQKPLRRRGRTMSPEISGRSPTRTPLTISVSPPPTPTFGSRGGYNPDYAEGEERVWMADFVPRTDAFERFGSDDSESGGCSGSSTVGESSYYVDAGENAHGWGGMIGSENPTFATRVLPQSSPAGLFTPEDITPSKFMVRSVHGSAAMRGAGGGGSSASRLRFKDEVGGEIATPGLPTRMSGSSGGTNRRSSTAAAGAKRLSLSHSEPRLRASTPLLEQQMRDRRLATPRAAAPHIDGKNASGMTGVSPRVRRVRLRRGKSIESATLANRVLPSPARGKDYTVQNYLDSPRPRTLTIVRNSQVL